VWSFSWAWRFCFARRRCEKKVNWRTVGLGLLLLIGFAILVLHTPVKYAFKFANDFVDTLLDFSKEGAKFVFGGLGVDAPPIGFVFASQILPTIIFFAAFMAVLCLSGHASVVEGLERYVVDVAWATDCELCAVRLCELCQHWYSNRRL
jgi:nucleoside permease NupC